MQIRYTYHARRRMADRRINEAQVREIVESPDDVYWGDEGETSALRRYLSHDIRVVYRELYWRLPLSNIFSSSKNVT